jgi:nitroimidazol reductase NimA-like FMN-containing flavoprotein (pyridoxamine 5'-phosphate oxidase superfamily)
MKFPKSTRNKIKRIPKRGHYDLETVFSILDSAFVCHIGFSIKGQPYVIPTAYGRSGNRIYIHGSSKSRMLLELGKGIPLCLTVTQLDGLVLARSVFHHSMNYRSAVIFGTATRLEKEEKLEALRVVSDHILPGRWDEARLPNRKELKATLVLQIEVEEASAKIRTGPPSDDKADYSLPIWAGMLPISTSYQSPIVDPGMKMEIAVPDSIKAFVRK